MVAPRSPREKMFYLIFFFHVLNFYPVTRHCVTLFINTLIKVRVIHLLQVPNLANNDKVVIKNTALHSFDKS